MIANGHLRWVGLQTEPYSLIDNPKSVSPLSLFVGPHPRDHATYYYVLIVV